MTNKCEHGYFKEAWRSCSQCRVKRFRDADEKLVERDFEIDRLRAEVADLVAMRDADAYLIGRLRAEVERYKAVAQMVADEYYGDEDGTGDWQTIARSAKTALRGGEAG